MAVTPQQVAAYQRRVALQRQRRRQAAGMTRRPSPIRQADRPLLEQTISVQYDTEAVVQGGSNDIPYFARPIGQAAIAGNTKTLADTNMVTAGQLPNPKIMVVVGFRGIPHPIVDNAAASPSVTYLTDAQLTAWMRLVWEFNLQFTLGTKVYVDRPAWQVPANVGVSVGGFTSSEGGSASVAAGDVFSALQPWGPYCSYGRTRLRIPPLQQFSARLYLPGGTRRNDLPSSKAAKYTVCMDGIIGREVQ